MKEFNVFYCQTTNTEGVIAQTKSTVDFDDYNSAHSRFYSELSQVGVAPNLVEVSAIMFKNNTAILDSAVERLQTTEQPQAEVQAEESEPARKSTKSSK